MKSVILFLLIFLTIAWLPGSVQRAQSQDMFVVTGNPGPLKNAGQFTKLYLNDKGEWVQMMPDGSTQTFSWTNGKSFVLTYIYVRFYANSGYTDMNPYRLYLKASNGTRLWIEGLTDLTYPGSSTVWGGGQIESISPGVVITVKPSLLVRQLPAPPNDPNSGPVIPGTYYIIIGGYVVP